MRKGYRVMVSAGVDCGPTTHRTHELRTEGPEQGIADMLACVDRMTLQVLDDAPLLVDTVAVRFELPNALPRRILRSVWERACRELASIVRILPEDGDALARNPFATSVDVPSDSAQGEAGQASQAVPSKTRKAGKHRGQA